MRISRDSLKKNLRLELNTNPNLIGLDVFVKGLERYYFSEISVKNCVGESSTANLVIEMNCQMTLLETLYHLDQGTWGITHKAGNGEKCFSAFSQELHCLKGLNEVEIDVEELSFFLADTSIVIKKITGQSIPQQFENIWSTIAEHYVHFTKGLKETPFEIYMPVFEENLIGEDSTLNSLLKANSLESTYYEFWGLYFESEADAVIYDLNNKKIISGDLQMLND